MLIKRIKVPKNMQFIITHLVFFFSERKLKKNWNYIKRLLYVCRVKPFKDTAEDAICQITSCILYNDKSHVYIKY